MSVDHNESRRKFQLERLVLFTDAVFAIAITLLVIEIKVPSVHDAIASEADLLAAIVQLTPKFLGFLVSFLLVGMYWTRHHLLFFYVKDYTPRLLFLNFFFLLTIVTMPFSTGLFGEYSTPRTLHYVTPLVVYILNICFSGVGLYLLWDYVGNPAHKVNDGSLSSEIVKAAKFRAIVISSVFALTIPVAFMNAFVARYVPILIPVIFRILKKK